MSRLGNLTLAFGAVVQLSACLPAERGNCSAPRSVQDIEQAEALVRKKILALQGSGSLNALDRTYDLALVEQCGERIWFEYHPKRITPDGLPVVGAFLLYAVDLSSGAVVDFTTGD